MVRWVWLLAALGLAGCAGAPTTFEPTAPGAAAPIPQSAPARMFAGVVERMEPVVERECRARAPRSNCDFAIVVDDRRNQPPNAFQTQDGTGRPIIGFNIALINDVANADELAFVFGHEAAHHIAGHLDSTRTNAVLGAAVFGALAARTGALPGDVQAAQDLGAAVGARSYSKAFEIEADELGTILTERAGYDALRGAEYFRRIPDPGNRFLGTHPPNAERMAAVRRTVAGL
ncbi:MAG: M48 family metallopeptidase [Shimia sp.]